MKKLLSFLALILLISSGFWLYSNRQWIVDTYVISQYKASDAVAEIQNELNLTDLGQRYFLVGQPEVSDSKQFNKQCQKRHEKSVVLGCYIAPFNVYIYNVTDQRLEGSKQVTAAHEMLHVAYDRLSDIEKKRIGSLLEADLPKIESEDKSLAERLAIYDKTEPGERLNELHSILGTEAKDLSAELEEYYAQYFQDRTIVTNFAAQYTKVFVDLQRNQQALVDELKELAEEINTDTELLNKDIADLSNDIESFNEKANTQGSFNTEEEFDRERQILLERQAQIESRREVLNQNITRYNQKREELQQLNIQVEELNTKLDSTASPSL